MHEVSLVEALFDQLDTVRLQAPGAPPATSVCSVKVRIGAASGVEPRLFHTAFTACAPARGYGSAALDLVVEAERWQCSTCGAMGEPERSLFCRACEAELTLVAGEGIFLDRLELEVPDV